MDSSSGQILIHQHCISGLIPSISFHLLSCAQITIVNQERVLPHFVLLVCDAHRISLLFVRNVHTSCGKGCASVRVPEPRSDWEAWVEVAVELFLLVPQLPLFLGHHPVYPRILPHDQLLVLPHRPNFRQTVAANQATDHTSQDLNSTFPLLLPSQPHH